MVVLLSAFLTPELAVLHVIRRCLDGLYLLLSGGSSTDLDTILSSIANGTLSIMLKLLPTVNHLGDVDRATLKNWLQCPISYVIDKV